MKHIFAELYSEYVKWDQAIGNSVEINSRYMVSVSDVLRAHYLLCDYFIRAGEQIALAGPRNKDLLASAVARQVVSWEGKYKWTEWNFLIATTFYGLVKNHPFHDGNKRTALLIALYQIFKAGRVPDTDQAEFETLVVRTAANELDEYKGYAQVDRHYAEVDARVVWLAGFFRRKTRKEDSRFYSVTFNQLQSILKFFGFDLANPSDNYIDIVRVETQSYGFMKRKTRSVTTKLGQIGFPGWTSEVGQGAIKTVRKVTGLTPQNGYDSQVFYKGADPLSTLIDRYSGPLKRLKDK
jgi:death-on-curing protein